MKNLAAILLVVNIMHAQDCNADEVEIWGWCYPIEDTTILQNTDNTSGDFPNEICELINLEIFFQLNFLCTDFLVLRYHNTGFELYNFAN